MRSGDRARGCHRPVVIHTNGIVRICMRVFEREPCTREMYTHYSTVPAVMLVFCRGLYGLESTHTHARSRTQSLMCVCVFVCDMMWDNVCVCVCVI